VPAPSCPGLVSYARVPRYLGRPGGPGRESGRESGPGRGLSTW
jgi:hypothetical protein